MEQGALGLGAPQPLGRHFYVPEAVVFDPYRHRILPSNKTRGEGRSLVPYSMANRRLGRSEQFLTLSMIDFGRCYMPVIFI